MHEMGFEIGNHTFNHQSSTAVLPQQYIRSVELLEQDFETHGIPPSTTFCYPMSRVNPNVHSFLTENGYLLARAGSPSDSNQRRPYDPLRDSPLHVPSFAIADGKLQEQPDLFSSLAKQAKDGKIVSFTFHGIPDEEHPGVGTEQPRFPRPPVRPIGSFRGLPQKANSCSQVSQPNLVSTYYDNTNQAGLYTKSQIQALNVDVPLLERNPETGAFKLTLGVAKSTTLEPGSFAPFPMTTPETSINGEGKLEFEFNAPDDAEFFRVEAD